LVEKSSCSLYFSTTLLSTPNFGYLLYNISLYSDEEIKGKAKTKILLTLLRDIFTKDGEKLEESILRSIHYLNELEDRQTGTEYLETIMRYVFSAGKSLTKRNINKMIHQIETNYPEGSEVTMTLAEMWMEEGREEGREEGGVAALSETTIQLLTEKFGKVPQDIKDDILNSDMATLKLMLFNIFRYESIEDVRRYIQ